MFRLYALRVRLRTARVYPYCLSLNRASLLSSTSTGPLLRCPAPLFLAFRKSRDFYLSVCSYFTEYSLKLRTSVRKYKRSIQDARMEPAVWEPPQERNRV